MRRGRARADEGGARALRRERGVAAGGCSPARSRPAQLADVVRALDAEGIEIQDLQLHAPTLDDVFLAKTGRSLEGAAEVEAAEQEAEEEKEALVAWSRSTLALQVGMLARRSVLRTLRQPAMVIPAILFPLILLSINSGGLDSATELPGFPTDSTYFQFALALAFVQGAVLLEQRRHERGERHQLALHLCAGSR